jgi:hypothetical protein
MAEDYLSSTIGAPAFRYDYNRVVLMDRDWRLTPGVSGLGAR